MSLHHCFHKREDQARLVERYSHTIYPFGCFSGCVSQNGKDGTGDYGGEGGRTGGLGK